MNAKMKTVRIAFGGMWLLVCGGVAADPTNSLNMDAQTPAPADAPVPSSPAPAPVVEASPVVPMTPETSVSLAEAPAPTPAPEGSPPPSVLRPDEEIRENLWPPVETQAGTNAPPVAGEEGIRLNFLDAPVDQLLSLYGDLTGRTVIRAPQITAAITLRSQGALTAPEAIQALESALALNGVSLVHMGPKFSKVTKSEVGGQEGLPLRQYAGEETIPETDQLVSYIISLQHTDLEEVMPVLQGIIHSYGKIQPLVRANSFMVTDTSTNIQRIREMLDFIDQPPAMNVDVRVFKLENGSASEIAGHLEVLLEDTQPRKPGGVTVVSGAPPAPVIATPSSSGQKSSKSDGGARSATPVLPEVGPIQGEVKIIADDRANILIVVARPVNFPFLEKVVKELDCEVEPEVVVHVVQLQWAMAEEMAGLLNDMLGTSGGAYGSRGTTGGTAGGTSAPGSSSGSSRSTGSRTSTGRSASSRSSSSRNSSSALSGRTGTSTSSSRRTYPSLGSLAGGSNPFGNNPPNTISQTRVLADLRSNSILLMGSKEDVADLQQVIEKLDIMLSQVLIEAVILEVELTKDTEVGISWLQRSMMAYNNTSGGVPGGLQVREPVSYFGGGWNPGGVNSVIPDPAAIARGFAMPPGLNYYTTISGMNLDAVIHMVSRSSDARILSTPVIMATDNEEAEIKNTQEHPVITSTSVFDTGSGAVRSTYEYKDIGISLRVRPHINPNRMVVMDIMQTADTIAGEVLIDNNKVPIVNKREITGIITVEDRTTIVLGGLVENGNRKGSDRVPILGDIPVLGWLFRNDSKKNSRTELLVLITPYVLRTPEEARAETMRLHKHSEMKDVLLRGWSDSPLAKPDPALEKPQKTPPGDKIIPAAPLSATGANVSSITLDEVP